MPPLLYVVPRAEDAFDGVLVSGGLRYVAVVAMVIAVEGRERSEGENRERSLTGSLDFCLFVIADREKSDLDAWRDGCGSSSGRELLNVAVEGDRTLFERTGDVIERRERERRRVAVTPAKSPLVTDELCL
jgi:hypothetical protein